MPGSLAYEGWPIDTVIERAVREARIYEENEVDGVVVENMWDLPYYSGWERTPPEEIAAHAVAAREVVKSINVPWASPLYIMVPEQPWA